MDKNRRIAVIGSGISGATTDGNAHGIGLADIITRRLHDGIDHESTWINSVTAGSLACGRIPPAIESDDTAIMAAAAAVPGIDPTRARVVRIRDTLSLTEIAVTSDVAAKMADREDCEVVGEWDGSWI